MATLRIKFCLDQVVAFTTAIVNTKKMINTQIESEGHVTLLGGKSTCADSLYTLYEYMGTKAM